MKKDSMLFELRSCVWEITLKCCFSCKYCGSNAGAARENELSLEECYSVSKQLAELGCKRVSLIGGEVFMRSDWKEIVRSLTTKGIRVNIITNGFIFTKAHIEEIKKLDIESISVSLDGPKYLHDKYRQEGSFKRALEAIRAIANAKIPVSVISTLNKENSNSLEELLEILCKENIWAWQLQACSPMGNAKEIEYRFDFEKVISFVRKYKDSVPFVLGIADNIGYFTEDEGSLRGSSDSEFAGCMAGITSLGIDSIGNVRGCESMYDSSFIEGNIRERSLKDIWEDEKSFSYNRQFKMDLITGRCRNCEKAQNCAAGCRSYNYFVHGKLYESPFCAK